jgi:hypothetical protein
MYVRVELSGGRRASRQSPNNSQFVRRFLCHMKASAQYEEAVKARVSRRIGPPLRARCIGSRIEPPFLAAAPNHELLLSTAGRSEANRARSPVGRTSLRARPIRIYLSRCSRTLSVRLHTPADAIQSFARRQANSRTHSPTAAKNVYCSASAACSSDIPSMLRFPTTAPLQFNI